MSFQVNKSLTIHEDSCPHLSEGCTCDDKNGILREEFICSLPGSKCPNQGNLLKGIDKKTGRREGIEPIKRDSTYVLLSVTYFL